MKKYFCFLLLAGSLSVQAQNLVPNPSFEDRINCPSTFSEIPSITGTPVSVTGWTRPTSASSDYFHTCSPVSPFINVSVPFNFAGTQPARTGNAYTGAYAYLQFNDYREYIQAQLSSPLIAGHHYHVSYWLSLGEWHSTNPAFPTSIAAIDRMGAYFGLLPEDRSTVISGMYDLTPQVVSPTGMALMDTTNWTNVSGMFTAAGNEQWMILGNFTDTAALDITLLKGNLADAYIYYYYDDACVLDMDGAPGVYELHDTAVCRNFSQVLHGKAGALSYLWDDGSTGSSRSVSGGGTYWVKSVSPASCTIFADTFHIASIDIAPPFIGRDTVICDSRPITLDAYNEAYKQYAWNTGATTPAISVSTPGTYYVTITSQCSSQTDSISISGPRLPAASLPADMLLCKGTPVLLRDQQDGVTYQWSTGDTSCCIEIHTPGNYTLTVSNLCGATASDEIAISYSGCKNCVLVPSAFSPNGDGLNDRFTIINNCLLQSYALKIFNRWGQLVFESYNPGEDWDGMVNGSEAGNGVYFYYLRANPSMPGLEKIERKGDITLIR